MAFHPNTVHRCQFSNKFVKGIINTLKKLNLSYKNGAKFIVFCESYKLFKKKSRNIILKNYM